MKCHNGYVAKDIYFHITKVIFKIRKRGKDFLLTPGIALSISARITELEFSELRPISMI
jgi:hypothetical protein